MHRAVVLAAGDVVGPEHLQLQPEGGLCERGSTLRKARAAFERDLVARRLAEHGASRTRAAEALGIKLKMRQYGL